MRYRCLATRMHTYVQRGTPSLATSFLKTTRFRVVLLTQFGANFISQLIASVADLNRARIAAENIMNVIKEPAVDMDNLSDEGLRPVSTEYDNCPESFACLSESCRPNQLTERRVPVPIKADRSDLERPHIASRSTTVGRYRRSVRVREELDHRVVPAHVQSDEGTSGTCYT